MEPKTFVCMMLGGIATFLTFCLLIGEIDAAIKIRVAPKYFLVQKFSKMIVGSQK